MRILINYKEYTKGKGSDLKVGDTISTFIENNTLSNEKEVIGFSKDKDTIFTKIRGFSVDECYIETKFPQIEYVTGSMGFIYCKCKEFTIFSLIPKNKGIYTLWDSKSMIFKGTLEECKSKINKLVNNLIF